jgi:rubredoxin-NAD+ reductase
MEVRGLTSGGHRRAGNGIAVDAATLCTSIEPITRLACVNAAQLCGADAAPFEAKPAVVRVKTTSHPLTLH